MSDDLLYITNMSVRASENSVCVALFLKHLVICKSYIFLTYMLFVVLYFTDHCLNGIGISPVITVTICSCNDENIVNFVPVGLLRSPVHRIDFCYLHPVCSPVYAAIVGISNYVIVFILYCIFGQFSRIKLNSLF